ncbi:hypothetical protein GGH95_006589, partial [Coemansia sp. RSA 1836]
MTTITAEPSSGLESPVRTKPAAAAAAPPISLAKDEFGGMAVDNSSENGDDIITKDKLLPKVKQ